VTNATDNLMPGSLRYAIMQANLPGNNGSIVSITNQVAGPIVLTAGELPINASMTIRNDSGSPVEIRQETASARVFHVGARASAVTITGLENGSRLTIDGGVAGNANGGGFLVDGPLTVLTLSWVDVVGNRASGSTKGGNGGAIYTPGKVILDHSDVGTEADANQATNQGGGVWAGRGLTLIASHIVGNQAGTNGGGVLVNEGDVTLADGSSVCLNQAPSGTGGGIAVATGSVVVAGGSQVDENSALQVGGIFVGNVVHARDDAVQVVGGSCVNDNSSTGGNPPSAGDFGGGGIAAPNRGNVFISHSQVSQNHTVGMFSGGIVVGLGDVTVTDGSQIDGNINNGPGGGIAANFLGTVTVTDHSQVNDNTGAAIGGGIVNFAGPRGGVIISAGSQVSGNTLTNGESLGQAIAVFLELLRPEGPLANFATAVGGPGGAAMLAALQQVQQVAMPLAQTLAQAVAELPEPPGLVVTGGGIGTLLAPISVTGGSQVNGNLSGERVSGGNDKSVGFGGGVFSILGSTTIDDSTLAANQAPYLDGGGIFDFRGTVALDHATVSGNSAFGDGGGIWSGGQFSCESSTLADNTAGATGGGLFNGLVGQAQVMDSEVQGNRATAGGGMSNLGQLTVARSKVFDNVATNNGGGIWNRGQLSLIDVFFADNTPDDVAP
jgi:hypothetical protein